MKPEASRASTGRPAPHPRFGFGRPERLVVLGLVTSVIAVYGRALWFGFVDLDDVEYVVRNPHVNAGLSTENAVWAVTRTYAQNWHPLTWLSHMLDCELYGLAAGGHHLTSIVLHIATAVVLFAALRLMTADVWPSGFVAAAFALHPLRVESVAWVSERKDVLSGFLFALTLLAYARYARTPSAARYLVVAGALALGLMAKQMLVTTPCVLLLLDYWPLRRTGAAGAPGRRVLAEKLPLLAIVAAAAAVTVLAQSAGATGGAVVELQLLPLGLRVNNAIVSYVVYLWQTVYPVDLAAFYPHPQNTLSTAQVAGSAVFLVLTTAIAVVLRRRHPALLVGWLWYLGMLVPVIGIVQVGGQGHADRYTYLPQIGLWVALAFGIPWRSLAPPRFVAGCALGALLIWAGLSVRQTACWRDPLTLWTHSLASTGPNPTTLLSLGRVLVYQKRWDEAAELLRQALSYYSDEEAHYLLAVALVGLGRDGEASEHFWQSYQANPARSEARTNLLKAYNAEGVRQARNGQGGEALRYFNAALAIDPDDAPTRRNKATFYVQLGIRAGQASRPKDAVLAFREATRIDPSFGTAYSNLGVALLEVGEPVKAVEAFRVALLLDPQDARARAHLETVPRRSLP